MRIVLADNSEFIAARISRSYRPEDTTTKDTINISLKGSDSIETVQDVLNSDNIETITVKRDGSNDVVYTGYSLQSIEENISDSDDSTIIILKKQQLD